MFVLAIAQKAAGNLNKLKLLRRIHADGNKHVCYYTLISTLTPLASSSFMRASTVLAFDE